jgi:hypothetical protein
VLLTAITFLLSTRVLKDAIAPYRAGLPTLGTCVCVIAYKIALCRFMKTPERLSALRNARLTLRKRDRRIAYIKRKLDSLTLERGVAVESDVQLEIQGVIERESLQMESLGNSDFRRIFWEQQVHILKTGIYTFHILLHR